MGRWLRRIVSTAGSVLSAPMAVTPQGRAALRTALFVAQMLPLPVKPQEWSSSNPVREPVVFPLPDGQGEADIYRVPGRRKRAGVLVFLGINTAPRDDPRVVNLGYGLARAGFVAMFPWSPSMMEKRLNPADPEKLVHAFQYLRTKDEVDARRVGMGGFCVGASAVLVAASDARIHEGVAFVSSFGGYYDLGDLVAQISSKRSFHRNRVEPWGPDATAREVITNQLIESLEGEEREALARFFLSPGHRDGLSPEGLSRPGAAVYRLLDSLFSDDGSRTLTLEEARGLIPDLSPATLTDLKRISPSAHVGNLKAQLLVAHDREDTAVPSEESRRLADSVAPRGGVRHTEFSFFSHVTPNKKVGPLTFVKEAMKLFRYTYSLIRVAA